jgi:hypothetical protein
VRQLEPQVHQRDQHPIAQPQAVVGASARGAAAVMTAALVQGALVGGNPGSGQLGGQFAEVLPGQPGEARMAQGRTGPCWLRHPRMIARAASFVPAWATPDQAQLSCTKS